MNILELANSYIEPVVSKLIHEGKVPKEFKIRQALVLLPTGKAPVVKFNEDITWRMKMANASFTPGQPVYLHEIRKITGVGFPKHNNKKVSYIFLYYTGSNYSIIFDFSPNSVNQDLIPEFGHLADKSLTSYYNLYFTEMAINATPQAKLTELREAGFFISPALMPFPFSILSNPEKNTPEFIAELIQHFNADKIKEIVENWVHLQAWNSRITLFYEAIENYRESRYASVVAALTPQLEGTLRDGVYTLKNDESYMNAEKALEILYRQLKNENLPEITHRMLSSFNDFFNNSCGLFQSFKKWNDAVSNGYLSRHAISHGKNTPDMYTKENCIRLFLILSTIHEITSALQSSGSFIKP